MTAETSIRLITVEGMAASGHPTKASAERAQTAAQAIDTRLSYAVMMYDGYFVVEARYRDDLDHVAGYL